LRLSLGFRKRIAFGIVLVVSPLALADVSECDADSIKSSWGSVDTLLLVGKFESEEDELVERESAEVVGRFLLSKVGILDSFILSFSKINENAVGVMLVIIGVFGDEEDARVESEFDEAELGKALWKAGVLGLEFVIGSSSKIHE